jgi:hypothetical protein
MTKEELQIISFFKKINLLKIKNMEIFILNTSIKINTDKQVTSIHIHKGTILYSGEPFPRVYIGYSSEPNLEYLYIPYGPKFKNKGIGVSHTPEEFKKWFIKSLYYVFEEKYLFNE